MQGGRRRRDGNAIRHAISEPIFEGLSEGGVVLEIIRLPSREADLDGMGTGDIRHGGPIPGVKLDDSGEVAAYDIAQQCHAVFANVRAVLESANADWDDLVDLTVFLTDIKRDFKTFNDIYAEYFSSDGPCRTTVEVNRLPTPIAIELKCVAIAKSK